MKLQKVGMSDAFETLWSRLCHCLLSAAPFETDVKCTASHWKNSMAAHWLFMRLPVLSIFPHLKKKLDRVLVIKLNVWGEAVLFSRYNGVFREAL